MPEIVEKQAELPLTPPPVVKARRFELPPEEKPKEPVVVVPPADSEPKAPENTAESAPATEPEVKPEPEVTPEQAAKREREREERRAQNKLEKAYRRRAEALAEAELLRKQLAEERARNMPKPPEGAPTLEQYDYDPEKYAAAVAEHAKVQAQKEFQAKQKEESEKQYNQKLLSDWEEKVEKAADKYDDFNSTIASSLDPKNPVAAAIMEADNGADILHYLASNPQEAKRLDAMNVRAQIREIGKIEAKLQAKPVEPKTPSKAPAPITPLAGTATVASTDPSETDDMKTWIRKREKQLGRR